MRAGLVVVGLLGAAPVFAADADPFAPSSGLAIGQGTLQGEPTVVGEEGFHGGLYAFSANDLALVPSTAAAPYFGAVIPDERLLGQVVGTTVHGGWTFGSRVRVDAFVPLYPFVQSGDWKGAGAGDVRLQATLGARSAGPLRFALIPKLELPTGTKKAYLARGTTGTLTAALGGPIIADRLDWLSNVGLALSPSDVVGDRGLGSSVDLLGGLVLKPTESFRVGLEVMGSLGLVRAGAPRSNSRAETGLFAQALHPSGLGLTAAGSVGAGGLGAPDYRVFAGITYGPVNPDRDHDGIHDRDDDCPLDPEDFDSFEDDNGCPDLDNDKDLVPDLVDVCRDQPEDIDGFGDADGCPDPDNDHDYVLDAADKCPNVAGEKEFLGCPDTDADGTEDAVDQCPTEFGPKESGGCPDKDKDLVPDLRDLCPTEPRPADEDPAISDGCPKSVYVTGKQIRIIDKVFFETNKVVIKPQSFGLLDKVAAVFAKNLWIEQVEVGGHTDDKGNDAANVKLSQGRAASVKTYLEKKGVSAERLIAKGYGEAKSIDTNRTEVGRANNRRVEFQILKQAPPSTATTRPSAVPGAVVPVVPTPVAPKSLAPAPVVPEAPKAVVPVVAPPAVAVPPVRAPVTAFELFPDAPISITGPQEPVAPVPSVAPVVAGSGTITVHVTGASFADVYVDDVKLPKTAPFDGLSLSPGDHVITVVNVRASLLYEERVMVKTGETIVIEAK